MLINESNSVITHNKTMIMTYDDINSVNVARHMALKMIKQEYWELRYGKVPMSADDYVTSNPSPKRELDERNSKWEIMKI